MMGRPPRDIPWLDKRDNGIWYVVWYDENARQTRRRSLNVKEVKEAARSYASFLFIWSDDSEQHRLLRLADVLDFYIKHHIDVDASDRERARHARKPLLKYFGDALLRTIDAPACHAYRSFRRAMNRSDGTVRRELYVISAAARRALLLKRITEADLPTIWAPPDTPARKNFLSQSQLKHAFTTADTDLQDFISLAYFTGARRRSIEYLTVEQVDLANSQVDLMPVGATPAQVRSKKRKPILPILPEFRERIAQLVDGKAPAERILARRDYYFRFKKHLTELGLPTKSYPHILRHSRATHLLQDGVPIYAVAKLLGDTVATIEGSYGHHSSEYLANALKGKGPRLD